MQLFVIACFTRLKVLRLDLCLLFSGRRDLCPLIKTPSWSSALAPSPNPYRCYFWCFNAVYNLQLVKCSYLNCCWEMTGLRSMFNDDTIYSWGSTTDTSGAKPQHKEARLGSLAFRNGEIEIPTFSRQQTNDKVSLLHNKKEKLGRKSLEPAFYCMFRTLAPVVATDNRVVCVRQTRNDEMVTDWWKWWAIRLLFKKAGERNYRVHLQRKKKKEAAAEWEHRWQLPPTPLPPSWHPSNRVAWETGTEWQRTGWLVIDETIGCQPVMSGASDAAWPRPPAAPDLWPGRCACFDSFTMTLEIKI